MADAGSDMMIVPDDRSTREIDAFGDQLDDYPDGKMVGAFGDGSGARADVWICPLWRLDQRRSQRQLLDLRLQVDDRDDLGEDRKSPQG